MKSFVAALLATAVVSKQETAQFSIKSGDNKCVFAASKDKKSDTDLRTEFNIKVTAPKAKFGEKDGDTIKAWMCGTTKDGAYKPCYFWKRKEDELKVKYYELAKTFTLPSKKTQDPGDIFSGSKWEIEFSESNGATKVKGNPTAAVKALVPKDKQKIVADGFTSHIEVKTTTAAKVTEVSEAMKNKWYYGCYFDMGGAASENFSESKAPVYKTGAPNLDKASAQALTTLGAAAVALAVLAF